MNSENGIEENPFEKYCLNGACCAACHKLEDLDPNCPPMKLVYEQIHQLNPVTREIETVIVTTEVMGTITYPDYSNYPKKPKNGPILHRNKN